MSEQMKLLMRETIELARHARERGNHPFGALLADADGKILITAENTVETDHDITGHAETNLLRNAAKQYPQDFLAECTLYASTEPCPMCAGAIYWANIRRVVFGLSQQGLYDVIGGESDDRLLLSCREVFSHGGKEISVLGPFLEKESRAVHLGFWDK